MGVTDYPWKINHYFPYHNCENCYNKTCPSFLQSPSCLLFRIFQVLAWKAFFQIKIYRNSPTNISTSDQRCFSVVDESWNNVDPSLKLKQNPTSGFQRCTKLIKRQCPTLKQRLNNVVQRWYNVDTMLFQPSVNVS